MNIVSPPSIITLNKILSQGLHPLHNTTHTKAVIIYGSPSATQNSILSFLKYLPQLYRFHSCTNCDSDVNDSPPHQAVYEGQVFFPLLGLRENIEEERSIAEFCLIKSIFSKYQHVRILLALERE